MLAIMGPSGAGKTTLLSLISQKADPALKVSGKVLSTHNLDPGQHSKVFSLGVQ